ncbi:unnamed protein product [Rotaria magnacalcarata]|uniref:Uncharacterized protein n=2 Tax=Rotaria magnacalcarata TaxID=392030 RepID=A0A816NSV1_9BILA|nr:unnamed protein product [Rotaria magnacalcarata]
MEAVFRPDFTVPGTGSNRAASIAGKKPDPKRTFQKNLNFDQNKENLNGSSQSNLQIVEENVKNQQVNNDSTNSLIDDKNLMAQDDFDKIVSSFSMSNEIESMDLFDENLNFTDGNVIRLSIFSCLKSHTLLVDLPLDNNPGQKRPLESDLNSNEHSKRSCSLNDLILTDIIELKEKVSELETRITKIEDGLMCKHKFLFLTCLRIIYCVLLWKVH